MKRPVHGRLTYLKEDNRHGLSRLSVRRHGLCPVYNLLCCLIILTVSARSRSRQGERLVQTGRKAVCLWDESRTSPVHSGRRKHSRRPPKIFVAAATNLFLFVDTLSPMSRFLNHFVMGILRRWETLVTNCLLIC